MRTRVRSSVLCVVVAGLGVAAACERTPDAPPFQAVHSWQLPSAIAALDIAQDGQSVLLGSATSESSLWTSPWNSSVPFDRAAEPLLAARFTRDGRSIFVRARGAIEVRAASGALLLDPHVRLKRPSQFALPSPNGRYVAFGASVYDIEVERLMVQAAAADDQRGLAFAGDRKVLITRAHAPQLTVLQLDGRETQLRHAPDEVTAGAISSDGRCLAAGTNHDVLVWDGDASEPSCERATKAPIEALRFSGSGRWLAALSGRRLLVLNADSCEPIATLPLLDAAALLDVDADLIAVADASANVYVWDVYNDRLIGRARLAGTKVSQLRVHAASRSLLVAANGDNGAKVVLLRITGP